MKDLIKNKDLLWEMVIMELKLRYARSFFGFLWAFIMPFITVAAFYIVFSLLIRIETKEAPFALYLMSAIFPWRFFQESLAMSATSLIDNKSLIREAKFPHYLIPLSVVLTNFIIFLPSLLVLIFAALFYGKLSVLVVFLPFIVILHLLITAGLSVIFSIIYVKYRDIKYLIEIFLLLLFYLTPAFYSIYLVKLNFPSLVYKIYLYNPFTMLLNLYRSTIFVHFFRMMTGETSFILLIGIPFIFTIIILALGRFIYRENKEVINDYLAY